MLLYKCEESILLYIVVPLKVIVPAEVGLHCDHECVSASHNLNRIGVRLCENYQEKLKLCAKNE